MRISLAQAAAGALTLTVVAGLMALPGHVLGADPAPSAALALPPQTATTTVRPAPAPVVHRAAPKPEPKPRPAPTHSRATGGTDSTSFNNAGLPGIGFGQDTIEYGSHTHHTNLDTYERIIEADVRDSAVVIAAALYQLAMQDQMLPRFSATEMPAPVPAR